VNVTFDGSTLADKSSSQVAQCDLSFESAVAETMDAVAPNEVNITSYEYNTETGLTTVTLIILREEIDDNLAGTFEEEITEFDAAVSNGRFTLHVRDFAASDEFDCDVLKTAFAQTVPRYFSIYTFPPTVTPTPVPTSEATQRSDSIGVVSLNIIIAAVLGFVVFCCLGGAFYYYYFYHVSAIKQLGEEITKCDPDNLTGTESIDPIDVERSTKANLRALSRANTTMRRTMSGSGAGFGSDDSPAGMEALRSPRPGQAANLGMGRKMSTKKGMTRGGMSGKGSFFYGSPANVRSTSSDGPISPRSIRGSPQGFDRAMSSRQVSSRNRFASAPMASRRDLLSPSGGRGMRPMASRQESYRNRMSSAPAAVRANNVRRSQSTSSGGPYSPRSLDSASLDRESLYSRQTPPYYTPQSNPQQGYSPRGYQPNMYANHAKPYGDVNMQNMGMQAMQNSPNYFYKLPENESADTVLGQAYISRDVSRCTDKMEGAEPERDEERPSAMEMYNIYDGSVHEALNGIPDTTMKTHARGPGYNSVKLDEVQLAVQGDDTIYEV
jgi:hypothetical protein